MSLMLLIPKPSTQVFSARRYTRNVLPQKGIISGMKGRPSNLEWPSRVARISSRLRTVTVSPRRRPPKPRLSCLLCPTMIPSRTAPVRPSSVASREQRPAFQAVSAKRATCPRLSWA